MRFIYACDIHGDEYKYKCLLEQAIKNNIKYLVLGGDLLPKECGDRFNEQKIFIEEYDIYPILLLDDLFSELDEKNRNNIFKSLDKNIQVFITTTDLKNINKSIINKAKIFNLDERCK